MGCSQSSATGNTIERVKHCSLGIVRLDYDYPAAPGDIDHPGSYGYDVYYRVVPGYTFSMCMDNNMSEDVIEEFKQAVNFLVNDKGVSGISGDCGFMMWTQKLTRTLTHKPVFMSALAQLPAVTCAFAEHEQIIIVTACGTTLEPMKDLIRDECGVDTQNQRYHIIGAEHVDGFEAVIQGGKVDTAKVEPGMVKLCQDALVQFPLARAFLFECTELPPYSDAVRHATGLPVYDSITNCDFFINGFRDNERFGKNNWQDSWDQHQADYCYGQNLSEAQRAKLVNKATALEAKLADEAPAEEVAKEE